LRAVAVMAVIVYHLHGSWLPGGFAGVDIFFVISGFVVAGSLASARQAGMGGYLLGFYARRVRRIAPALVVMLVVTGVLSAMFVNKAWLSDSNTQTGQAAFFGISNLKLIATDGNYFSPRTELNPFTHTWSLGVEEQFYLIFPLLFFAWTLTRRRHWMSVALIAGGAVASLLFAISISTSDRAVAFYALPSRFWQLAAGGLLFQFLSSRRGGDRPSRPRRWHGIAVVAGAGILVAGLWLARPGYSSFPDGLLPVIGTVCLLLFLHDGTNGGFLRRGLESPVAVGIGLLSYSLYLWHWPIFVMFRWTTGLERIVPQVAALVLTFAAAAGSYFLIERPFRYGRIVVRTPRLAVIGIAAVAVLLSAALFREVGTHSGRLSLSTVSHHSQQWYPAAAKRKGCPTRSDLAEPRAVFTAVYPACSAEPTRGRIFAIGDSHTLMYARLLDDVALQTNRDVFVSFREGCGFATFLPGTSVPTAGCDQYDEAPLRKVERFAEPGDVLFLASLRLPRISDQTTSFSNDQVRELVDSAGRADRTQEVAAATAVLQPLAQRGVHIVFPAPTPVFPSPAFRCVDWFDRENPVCDGGLSVDRELMEEYRRPTLAAYDQVAKALPGVSVWDPLPVLCPQTVCRAVDGATPLFFDGDHVSAAGNKRLEPSLEAFLDRGSA
jgi:peptidoglycan/LPS O-acetylase OafA/YrhL